MFSGCGDKNSTAENINLTPKEQYNFNISTNNKPIGKNDIKLNSNGLPISSFDELFQYVDVVVEGEVISEGTLAYDCWPLVVGTTREHELNIQEKVEVTLTQFKVTRVLYGDVDSDTITILQLGPVNTDIGELKIEKGQKLVCFLKKTSTLDEKPFENLYGSVSWENGFYDISNENSTRAFSNVNGLCKYDGKPSSEFIKEIESVIKKYN